MGRATGGRLWQFRDSRGYGWVVIGSFTFNYAAIVISLSTLGLLLPDISEELSLSPSQQGLLASSVLFANLIFEIPSNWWLSRYRPWRVASISFMAASLSILLKAWAPTFIALVLARVLVGLLSIFVGAPRTLLVLQWMTRRQIGLANSVIFGLFEGLDGVGSILISQILVWLGDWRDTLYLWAGVCVTSSLLWLVLGKERRTSEHKENVQSQRETPLGSLFRYGEPWILGLGSAAAVGSNFAFGAFWPTFTGDEYGTSITLAGLIVGLTFMARAPAIFGVNLTPFLVNRTSLIMIICGIGLTASNLGLLATGSAPLLIILGIVNGMMACYYPSLLTSIYGLPAIRPREIAVAGGLLMTLNWTGAALGPLIAGSIQETTDSLGLALVVTSLGPMVMTFAGIVLADMRRRGRKASTESR